MNSSISNEDIHTAHFNITNPVLAAQEQYLKTIAKNDLENIVNLFDSLKQYGSETEITYTEPFYKLYETIYNLKLVFDFNWMKWKEGIANINNPDFDFSSCSLLQVSMYLTVIFRQDRYCEGVIESNYKNGTLKKIFSALR